MSYMRDANGRRLDSIKVLSEAEQKAAFVQRAATGYDLVLLLGQSNMVGQNAGPDARLDPADPRVFTFDATGTYADQVAAALDPLGFPPGAGTLGPGTAFARWYADTVPGRKVLLVPCAWGGTSLTATSGFTWNPDVDGALYGNARFRALSGLSHAGDGSRIVAALWSQGEQDAQDGVTGALYAATLDKLVVRLRSDLSEPNLPFVIGGMVPEWVAATPASGPIQAALAATPGRVRRTAFVPGPAGVNNGADNLIHYAPEGARRLGRLLAAALPAAQANG